MTRIKELAWSFLIGGALCLVGEIILVAVCFTPLYEMGFQAVTSLLLLGIFGGILFVFGVYQKLEQKGGMGAVMPLSGLMAAIAGMFCEVSQQLDSKGKAAFLVLRDLMAKVILLSITLSAVISAVYYFSGLLGAFCAPYAPGGVEVALVGPPNGTEAGPPAGIPVGIHWMGFLWAFVVGGALGALFQLAISLTKLPVPTFLVIMFVLGAILVPTGIMKALVQLSGAGTLVYILIVARRWLLPFLHFCKAISCPSSRYCSCSQWCMS